MRKIFHAAATLVVGGALLVPVAMSQTAKPTPGCAPVNPDKKGDVENANLDITGFWFKTEGGKTTANVQIANLTQELPDESTGMNWYVLWTFDDAQRFVQAQVEAPNLTGPTFGYGTVDGNIRSQAGDSPGVFVEGEEGVISIEIPADIGGVNGTELKAVTADTQTSLGVPGVASALSAVDTASGKPHKIGACESAGGGAPAPTPAPGPSPAPAPTPSPGPGAQPSASGQLDIAVAKKLPRAKKVKKSLALAVSSKGGVSDVNAALYKGTPNKGKIAGQGKLAKLKGKGKLKLKMKGKFKKGSYTLVVLGKNADGTAADRSFKLKFK